MITVIFHLVLVYFSEMIQTNLPDVTQRGKRVIIGHSYYDASRKQSQPGEDEPDCVVYHSKFLYFSERTKICNECIDSIREFLIYCETSEPLLETVVVVAPMDNKRKLVPVIPRRDKMRLFRENQYAETDECDVCSFKSVQFSESTIICNACIRKVRHFLDCCAEENKEFVELFHNKQCTSCSSNEPLSKFVIETTRCNNCLQYAYMCSNCSTQQFIKDCQTLCINCKKLDLSKVIKCAKCLVSLNEEQEERGIREYNCSKCDAPDHMCIDCSAKNFRSYKPCLKCK